MSRSISSRDMNKAMDTAWECKRHAWGQHGKHALHSNFDVQACVCTIHAYMVPMLSSAWASMAVCAMQKFSTLASIMSTILVTKVYIYDHVVSTTLIWSSHSTLLTSVP